MTTRSKLAGMLSLGFALFMAGQAHAQADAPFCFDGRLAPFATAALHWHTTLAGGTSQPKLFEVGYVDALPTFDLLLKPVLEFSVPSGINLARRYITNVDLIVDPKNVTGPDTDVIFSIGLMGPQGLGDMSKLSAAQLGDLVEGTPGFTSEIFFDGDNTQQVIWVDDLVDPITAAIQGRQKYLSLYFSPSAARDGSTPSFAATLNAARLKIYHCPID